MPRAFLFLFDGTGNEPTNESDPAPTNVFKINSLIAEHRIVKRRRSSQITFYVPGIGTKFTSSGLFTKIRQLIFGDGLDEMVMRSYINLASNFRVGDNIVVVGFSRGAVAARLFCRLISDFGLLRPDHLRFFSEIFASFSEAVGYDFHNYQICANQVREKYANELNETIPSIDFLGLFDCVEGSQDKTYSNFLSSIDSTQSDNITEYMHLMSLHDMRDHFRLSRMKPIQERGREIWMPGVHSDIGGGYRDHLLAKISLYTMAIGLKKRANIALEQISIKALNDDIQAELRKREFYVNLEPDMLIKRNRTTYFSSGDRQHYVNVKLDGARVFWKGEKWIPYSNRFKEILDVDRWTRSLLR